MTKILRNVPDVVFAEGAFRDLPAAIESFRRRASFARHVLLLDSIFQSTPFPYPLPLDNGGEQIWVDIQAHEPRVEQVDGLVASLRDGLPVGLVVGIGGGATLDMAKGVSILLNNPGSCAVYQGWDKVKNPAMPKIGIPTLSGTGAEVSRTCVFTSPTKKQGINDDASRFDMVIMDPVLLRTVPRQQRFFTAMDCYIHSVEALRGSFLNAFSRAYAEKAMDICLGIFIDGSHGDADLMAASYFGGCSIVYSEVGICHALSYGISFILGYRHGEANSIVFDYLEDFYPEDVPRFRHMLKKNQVALPRNIMKDVTDAQIRTMTDMAYLMEKPLTNALGPDWRAKLPPERIASLYRQM